MKLLTGIILPFTVLLFIISGCTKPQQVIEYEKKLKELEEKRIKDSLESTKRNQYIMGETFTGDRSQIIDLITGPATFIINHEGSGTFVVKLLRGDGTFVTELANVTGNYKGTKSIEVQETAAYILDIKTQGRWSVTRK
jgi:hypothetical protein